MNFRDYQINIINKGCEVLSKHNLLYLAMEVRTGKTLTALGICENLNCNNVLFVTKKKAISSIVSDYKMFDPNYYLEVINYESLHKITRKTWDIIIVDEAHSLGAFPKPSKRAKNLKILTALYKSKVILLSGTPTPESYSQMYHQVYYIPGNPFSRHKSFYKFASEYIDTTKRPINGTWINDYSKGKQSILDDMKPYTISYTQKQAGFVVNTNEEILRVDICKSVKNIIKKLTKDKLVRGEKELILADTPVKLMTKTHQLSSGTIKFESGRSMVLCTAKAKFIKEHFKNKKIGIFYKFKEELNALKQVFDNNLCTTLEEFNATDKNIALQIVSGREGISLEAAQALVYYNIDFSATSYWQSRDRMTTKTRLNNKIYWIFSNSGMENDIYNTVIKKKDYTLSHFRKDLLSLSV